MNSKELLEKTGISRATLNNYIGWGIVPKPEVLPPGPNDGAAPRIGYYPDETVERIAQIQRLKKDGWGMQRISEHFASEQARPAGTATRPTARPAASAPAGDAGGAAVTLTHVAILASELQDAVAIWSALPPDEYFGLINGIRSIADPIFTRHHGTPGKHPGDGIVCHFFPRPDSSYLWNSLAAALELQAAARQVSREWQLRKAWTTAVYMNTGVSEGQEWLGRITPGRPPEFTALAETSNQAVRISEFAGSGAVWATKSLVLKLTAAERRRLNHGVRQKNGEGQEIFVSSVFSRIETLVDLALVRDEKLNAVARLPITEIVGIPSGD